MTSRKIWAVQDYLEPHEIKNLIQASDWKGFQAVLTTWGIISGSFALVAFYPGFFTVILSVVLLGGRHLALGILMHDAAHYSLFKTRVLNDWIGTWLCAYPGIQDLKAYRKHHLKHHQFAGTEVDPDLDLVEGFPVTQASMRRKFIRDLTGIAGIKRLYGVFLMNARLIEYTVSGRVVVLDRTGRTGLDIFWTGVKNSSGWVFTQLVLFAVLWGLGRPSLFLLWVAAYLTTFSLFIRIRSIAEHACTKMGLDPILCTRTTQAGIPARLSVAPHYVNYHLEHHILMTVPGFKLRKMHKMLLERGGLKNAFLANGYLEVLKLASSLEK